MTNEITANALYETDAQGQKVKRMSSKWYAVFVGSVRALRRLPLLEDKKSSTELARKIERLNSIRAGGDLMTADLTRYVETMPPGIRAKLAEWGILSAGAWPRASRWSNISPTGKQPCWRRETRQTCRACHAAGPQRRLMRAGSSYGPILSASKMQSHLAGCERIVQGRSIGGARHQRHFQLLPASGKAIRRWMVQDGRASENPLAHLKGMNVKTDRRHDRRARNR